MRLREKARPEPGRTNVRCVLFLWFTAGLFLPTAFVEGGVPPVQEVEICPAADLELKGLLQDLDLLVLGEIHGSREIPAYVARVVCAALDLSRPVTLGLEIPVAEQGQIDAFLQSSGDSESRRILLEGPFWQRDQQDGRSSQAILELLEASRRLIRAGRPLRIHCFDAEVQGSDDTRDHAMARSLLSEHSRHPESTMIVLTGNIHARKAIGTSRNPELKPTGWYLDQSVNRFLTLNARHAPGTFWVCTPECGARKLGGSGSAGARGATLFDDSDRKVYDGVFDIGVPTASAPAKETGPEA